MTEEKSPLDDEQEENTPVGELPADDVPEVLPTPEEEALKRVETVVPLEERAKLPFSYARANVILLRTDN